MAPNWPVEHKVLDASRRQSVWYQLVTTLPNWDRLPHSQQEEYFDRVCAALSWLEKRRADLAGRPRLGDVKARLKRVDGAVKELRESLVEMDGRTAAFLEEAAGGGRRLRGLEAKLRDAASWVATAIDGVPAEQGRLEASPGFDVFVRKMARIWESAGGDAFKASKKIGGCAFIEGLLRAASLSFESTRLLSAAQRAVSQTKSSNRDRVVRQVAGLE